MIAGLLLAAGRGSRFGSDKMLALLNDVPVVRLSVAAIEALDDVIVVGGPGSAAIADALRGSNARVVTNAEPDAGMSSSIRAGVAELRPSAEAVVIALGDQPYARASATSALVSRWNAGEADIVVPCYTDGVGHPVLFGRACFPALEGLEGDRGARSVIESGTWSVAHVAIPERMPMDVDTPEALALAASRAADDASDIHRPR